VDLFGTTYQGGWANLGLVFKLNKSGETVLHNFAGGSDGANPYAGVKLDSAGNLYGTTYRGGTANAGVVYKVSPTGKETSSPAAARAQEWSLSSTPQAITPWSTPSWAAPMVGSHSQA
jgi:uncharacterized repeat protein (TIGR03803 family)